MPLTIPDFWKLVIESRLLSVEQCQQLGTSFGHIKGAAGTANAKTLAEWLTSVNAISRYQATVLLGGRPGPFFYGEYKVYDRVENGRFKGLFRAIHAPTNHPVVLEFAAGPVVQDPQQWAFVVGQVTGRLAASFPHWHRYFEVVDLGTFKFLVAEDLAGMTLEERLAQVNRLSPPEACSIIRHVALALGQLHRWNVPHGDIRPANVWLDGQGNARLLQDPLTLPAPLAMNASDAVALERADYAAPELGQPGRPPDVLTDIYALGCLLYRTVSGQPPFPGGAVGQKLQRHAAEPIQPLAPYGVPEPLMQMVAYLMAKNPGIRYQSAAQVADQLTPFVDPALLYGGPPQPPPTLGAFEQFIQMRGPGNISPEYVAAAPQPAAQQPAVSQATAGQPAASPPTAPATTSPAAGPNPAGASQAAQKAPSGTSSTTTPVTRSSGNTGRAAAATAPAVPGGAAVPPGPAAAASAYSGGARPGSSGAVPVPATRPATAGQPQAASSHAAVQTMPRPSHPARPAAASRQSNQLTLWLSIGGGGAVLLVLLVAILMGGDDESPDAPPTTGGNPVVTQVDSRNSGKGTGSGSSVTTGKEPSSIGKNPSTDGGVKSNNGKTKSSQKSPAGDATTDGDAEKPAGPVENVVADDGKQLWASPTSGKPVAFDYVPPGGQVFLIIRPSDLVGSTEGARVLKSLGPAFETLKSIWEKDAGVKFEDCRQLIVSLHDNGDQFPRIAAVVHLNEPIAPDDLVGRWGDVQRKEVGGANVFQGPAWSYLIPAKEEGRTFVMGAAEDVNEVAEVGAAPPALRREIERLRRMTDDKRHVTMLFAPNFLASNLFRDGRTYYFGAPSKVREPLDWLLKDDLQAVAASLHCSDDTFLELRIASNLNKDMLTLASELRNRLEQAPDRIFDYIATLGSNPYWEKVRLQYPNMIRFLHSKTRIGTVEDVAVINAALPGPAAHNLVFGSELVIASTPGAVASVAQTGGGAAKPEYKTVEDVLYKFKTTMAFEANSLEFAIQDIAKDVNESLKGLPFEFKIRIMGDDLKLDGITRNQTVRDFNHRDKTVADILTAMVMKANPVTTVKEPNEKDQKLLWVVEKDPDDPTKTIVLVTTRAISEQKKYKLPAVFQPK